MNAIKRMNMITRWAYGQLLGLGRPLTRREATGTGIGIFDPKKAALLDFLEEAALSGNGDAKWYLRQRFPMGFRKLNLREGNAGEVPKGGGPSSGRL